MTIQSPNTSLLDAKNSDTANRVPAALALNSSDVSFEFKNVQPPSALYVDNDDSMVITLITSVAGISLTVNARLLLPNGRVVDNQFVCKSAGTYLFQTFTFPLAQGYLMSASCSSSALITRGTLFARAFLKRSASGTGQPSQLLFSDYIAGSLTPVFPGGRIQSPVEGPGNVYTATTSNPAAGADFSFGPNNLNVRWKVRSLAALLTTSAAAGNRQVSFEVGGVGVVWQAGSLANVPASQAVRFSMAGVTPYTAIQANIQLIAMPPDLYISNNGVGSSCLQSLTTGLLAGDQWSAIFALVEEWFDFG